MLHLPLSFPGWEGDLFSDFMAMPGYGSCRGSACAAPRLYRPAAATPTFRVLHTAPAFPEPEEPEVYISRTEEGVLAACPLGRAFSRDDISLDLEGRDLTIAAWHPQTRHWRAYGRERPAAYRRTLELAPHLDAQRMRARLDTATGTLELFFPYRRVAPAPQPRPRVVVVQSTMAVPVPPAAPAPRPSLVRASAPAPRVQSSPSQPAAAPAPAVTPAAAPVPAVEMEADDASATAQRAHRRRQRHHHAQRRRSCSPKQAEQACPTCCCQAASPAPAPPASQQQQPKAQPRVIPIECGEPSSSAVAAEPQCKAAQRSRPSSPAAAPVESPRSAAASPSASPAASPSAAAKGKGPASPEQVAKWQRQQRAAAAAKRIATGVASDSDWEDADGSVSECGLDD